MQTLTELRAERTTLLSSIATLRAKARDNAAEFSAADSERLTRELARVAEIDAAIDANERLREQLAQADALLSRSTDAPAQSQPTMPRQPVVSIEDNSLASRTTRRVFRDNIRAAQDAGDWFRSRFLATATTTNNTNAGYLVPPSVLGPLVKLREEMGLFRQFANNLQMPTSIIKIPRWRSGPTVYYPGEAALITESSTSYDSVTLEAKKYAVLVKWSREMARDSAVDFAAQMIEDAAYKFAEAEDDNAFNGTGTSTYAGVRGIMTLADDAQHLGSRITAGTGETGPETIKIDTLNRMVGVLPTYARAGAAWYCSPLIASLVFYRAKLTANGALAAGNTADTITGQMVPTFLGYPIRVTTKLYSTAGAAPSTNILFLGNLQQGSIIGDRSQIEYRILSERYADTDEIALVATQSVAILNHEMGNATTPGSFVVLRTAAS